MRYEKPEIAVLASAASAIQGCGSNKTNQQVDCETTHTPSGAYEADE
jgi:hypothetical protein